MKSHRLFAGAAALVVMFVSTAALADDPNDPSMRDPRNRARDRAIIRQLNVDQLAYVRARDARYAEGWRAHRELPERRAEHAREVSRYDRERDQYERDMAAWRRDVAECRAGNTRRCAR